MIHVEREAEAAGRGIAAIQLPDIDDRAEHADADIGALADPGRIAVGAAQPAHIGMLALGPADPYRILP